MGAREQARWTRARLGRGGPPPDLLTARFERHVYAPHAHEEFTIGVCVGGGETIDYRGDRIRTGPGPGSVAVGALFLDERLTPTVITAFALVLAGSVLATAAERPARPVAWSPRQTSRADGRVEFPQRGLPEERPGSTGQGGG